MSRLVSKIMLALLMIPAGFVVYAAVAGVAGSRYGPAWTRSLWLFAFTSIVTWAFVAVWWTLLWRSSVRWTRARVALTIGSVAGAAMLGALGAWPIWLVEGDVGAFIGGIIAIVGWLTATVFIWRETAAERKARLVAGGRQVIVCPRCGYNLTGLRQAACPECGGTWTIEELMSLQPAGEEPEL